VACPRRRICTAVWNTIFMVLIVTYIWRLYVLEFTRMFVTSRVRFAFESIKKIIYLLSQSQFFSYEERNYPRNGKINKFPGGVFRRITFSLFTVILNFAVCEKEHKTGSNSSCLLRLLPALGCFFARLILQPWRWRWHVPPRHWLAVDKICGVVS
jgi:hypothetical protein